MCVCTVYIYYTCISTHIYVYILQKIVYCMFLYVNTYIIYIIYKYKYFIYKSNLMFFLNMYMYVCVFFYT